MATVAGARVVSSLIAGSQRTDGLTLAPDKLESLLSVDEDGLRDELEQIRAHLATFGDRLPAELRRQFHALEERLA